MQASSLRLAQTELEREMAPCRKSRLLFIAKGGKFRVTLLRYTPDTCHFIFQFTAYIYYIGTQQKPPAYELLLLTISMTFFDNVKNRSSNITSKRWPKNLSNENIEILDRHIVLKTT